MGQGIPGALKCILQFFQHYIIITCSNARFSFPQRRLSGDAGEKGMGQVRDILVLVWVGFQRSRVHSVACDDCCWESCKVVQSVFFFLYLRYVDFLLVPILDLAVVQLNSEHATLVFPQPEKETLPNHFPHTLSQFKNYVSRLSVQ